MKLIGHRGYKNRYIKENTYDAFDNAFNNDFIGIEFDVRKTKDNELVICHDAFIDRVSNGSGLISNMSYKELLTYNFGTKKVPSKIPILKDVLIKYKGIKIVELKTTIDFDSITSYIDDNTYFISFNSSYIYKLKSKYPQYKFGILNYILNSKDGYNLDIICLLDTIVTSSIVKYFTNKDILIFIYGIGKKPKYLDEKIYYIINKKFD